MSAHIGASTSDQGIYAHCVCSPKGDKTSYYCLVASVPLDRDTRRAYIAFLSFLPACTTSPRTQDSVSRRRRSSGRETVYKERRCRGQWPSVCKSESCPNCPTRERVLSSPYTPQSTPSPRQLYIYIYIIALHSLEDEASAGVYIRDPLNFQQERAGGFSAAGALFASEWLLFRGKGEQHQRQADTRKKRAGQRKRGKCEERRREQAENNQKGIIHYCRRGRARARNQRPG